MYQAKHFSGEHSAPGIKRPAKRRQLRWKKQFALALSVIVLVLGMVGGSLAWLVDTSDEVENNFDYGEVTCSATCTTVTNTGNVPAYIRIAVIPEISSGNDLPGNSGMLTVSGTSWEKNGNYYIYTQPVQPGATVNFAVDGNSPYNVLAEAIQAEPDGRPAKEAWGYNPVGA